MRRLVPVLVVVSIAGCGKKKGGANDSAPPAKPVNGAPIAFVVGKITPGENMKGSLAVREYNFSDKKVAQYGVLIRYYDAAGKVIPVKQGTPFEKGFDNWSFSGRKYACAPKSWCSFDIDDLDVPAKAAKAEVLAERVTALKDDGMTFEEKELFQMKDASWPGSENDPKPTAKWPDAWAAFGDEASRKAAWQGAWAGDGFSLGNKAAWQIDGDKITFVDSKGEEHYTLTIDSPCTAGFGGGKNGGWVTTYTIKDGQLVTGLGDAGQRKDGKAIVCAMGDVYTFDGTNCLSWSNHFGNSWESQPAKCGIKQDNGKDVFFYTWGSGSNASETTLPIEGDVIWSEQLAKDHAQKVADLAAAKTAQGL